MTPKDPHVSGWKPDFLPADHQLGRQEARLRSLIGRRVDEAWIVWDLEHDEWFADLPVVLKLECGSQLEVCWEKFDDLSITWNTIDVAVTPKAWVDLPLEWRRGAHDALAAVTGAPLEQIAATSFRFVTWNVDDAHDRSEAWLTNGLWLGANGSGLQIFNALDENGLNIKPPTRDTDHDWRSI